MFLLFLNLRILYIQEPICDGTDNHLSTEGAQIRTEKVIHDLKEQLAKEEKK